MFWNKIIYDKVYFRGRSLGRVKEDRGGSIVTESVILFFFFVLGIGVCFKKE